MAPSPPLTWTADLALRFRRFLLLKVVGISAFTWLFFLGYFHLLRHPSREPAVMPLTALDHLIPFQPQTLVVYLSLWFYVGIAPGLQLRFAELAAYGVWVGALCLAGLGSFYLWPTAVPMISPGDSGFPGFAMLQGVDAAGNACPSMHVAVAMFTAIWVDHLLRQVTAPAAWRVFNAAWFVAIAYSTLAVKQHVVLDVAAGALLGMAFAWPSLRWRPAPHRGAVGAARADIIGRQ